jgi:hypothetical protein
VVKDAYSDNDRRPPPPTDDSGHEADGHFPQSAAGNLTQELAQLLAASIAQNQASRARGGVPTNAELTSLANLVSAAAAHQRTLAPVFKDGLSALSYSQPRPAPAPQPTTMPQLELGHDDEPMPIPSTWRQPPPQDDDRWFRQQMGAAVLGLIAGLMIVVPAVLWLSGFFSAQRPGPTAAGRVAPAAIEATASPDTKTADVRTVKVRPVDPARPVERPPEKAAQFVTSSIEPPRPVPVEARPLPPPVPVATAARLIDPKARIEELLAQAAQRVESGDVTGAREMLAGADDGGQGSVSFALAETYDPNMLAAWGTRGVAADAAKARALYRKAFSLGVARAQNRLDALK